jgi:hypothetical protein
MDGYSTWRNGDGFFRDAATDINWMETLTGKIGVPLGHALVYFKGGAVWADEDYSHTRGAGNASYPERRRYASWLADWRWRRVGLESQLVSQL